ncbi:plasmid pRiA4b ORF-3 family protein [Arthrobacter sp. 35/47]|uniref:plasmid pRiA4b ORF-3 family protein n=1 Tax=Arthrobacter sp. 35/47 TaxID=269454 RepID=UPI0020A659D8|nr:plasmid pRiA4b ORF-3 family protein [Arthrobacter sp. 35/47]
MKVSIVGAKPAIWRLLDLDPALTLDKVHDVLQTAVGWRDTHLHSFTDTDPYKRLRAVNGQVPEPRRWVAEDLLDDFEEDLLESDYVLGQVLTAESGPLFYEYDFGDGWIHRLELTGSVPKPANAVPAHLVDGARRAPLEDSGGIGGYLDLLDALASPSAGSPRTCLMTSKKTCLSRTMFWVTSSRRRPVPCSMNTTSEMVGSTAWNSPEVSPSRSTPHGHAS